MPLQQRIEAIVLSILLFIFIIHNVKKGKLREEFAWLWLLTGLCILIIGIWFNLLEIIRKLIGFQTPASTIFFFGLFSLVLINLHSAIKISSLANKQKNLIQEVSILKAKLKEKEDKEKSE